MINSCWLAAHCCETRDYHGALNGVSKLCDVLTRRPVSTLGSKMILEPSMRPFSSRVPSLSCLRTPNNLSIIVSKDADASSYRRNLFPRYLCLTIDAWRRTPPRSPLAMQKAYPVLGHFQFLGHELLEVLHCVFIVQTDGEIATRRRLYI